MANTNRIPDENVIRAHIAVKEDAGAYAVGVELSRIGGGRPYKIYSIYFDEAFSKSVAVGEALSRVIAELDENIELLTVGSLNNLSYRHKNIKRITNRGNEVDIYTRRLRYKGSKARRAIKLAEDAMRRRSSIIAEV